MRFRLTLLSAALAGAVYTPTIYAADWPAVTLSGFGTLAATRTDTDQAEFIRPNQAVGAKKDWRTGVDSNFGLQATAKATDSLSFTVQGLVRKNPVDDVGAELAWAFAKWKATDDLNFRVGRIGTPVYMISDFRQVGYANTMIRPPAEVYRQVSGDYYDGADVVWQPSFGDTTLTVQFGGGHTKQKLVGNYIEYHPLLSLHVVAENGPFTLRFGRANAKFSITGSAALTGLGNTLRASGFTAVADQLRISDVDGSFTSFGGTMDWKNIVLQGEYAMRRTDTRLVMQTNSWYLMGGYRFGKVLPYYYHGNIDQKSIRTMPGMPTTGPAAPLTAAVNGAIRAAIQKSNAVGVRWDFRDSMALKVQWDRITPKDGAGAFIKPAPGFTGPVNVYAAGIDFVF
ncbi:hypothetical protein GCM10027277_01850 [Pseudoduganella ginsengisoli]|uniref:Porin n=1 Tax=Pseudoduganella ginsengisoli TaxID=1462440 RepID=A0A6L6Q8Q1_9BURK|nr:hypothetical protein [Pseudoduganella ginsengisoli]MTW05834.1 hypothetical protein [Pseudoduganella ginsengisoli]